MWNLSKQWRRTTGFAPPLCIFGFTQLLIIHPSDNPTCIIHVNRTYSRDYLIFPKNTFKKKLLGLLTWTGSLWILWAKVLAKGSLILWTSLGRKDGNPQQPLFSVGTSNTIHFLDIQLIPAIGDPKVKAPIFIMFCFFGTTDLWTLWDNIWNVFICRSSVSRCKFDDSADLLVKVLKVQKVQETYIFLAVCWRPGVDLPNYDT